MMKTSTNYFFEVASSVIEASFSLCQGPSSVGEIAYPVSKVASSVSVTLFSVSEAVSSQITYSNIDQGHNRVFIKNDPTTKVQKVYKERKWFRGRFDCFSDSVAMDMGITKQDKKS